MSAPRNDSVAIPYTTHTAEVHSIAVYEWGNPASRDVVFCVHGLTRNAQDFAFLAAALEKDYRVIAIDMPGRGQSEWLKYKEEYSYVSYLTCIRLVLDALALPPVCWVGTSMGGIIGMMLAASDPQRIRKLLLNDIGSLVSADALRRIASYVGTRMRFHSRAEAEAAMREIYAPFGLKEEVHWQHLLRHDLKDLPDGTTVRNYDPAIGDALKDPAAIKDVDLSAFWNAVSCPTMLVRGAQSDILTHGTAQAMQKVKPGMRFLEVPGVGHAPPLFTADQIDPIVAWIRE